MKPKAKFYAAALVRVMVSKKNNEKKITDNFFALLQKNGDIKKAKEIIFLAEDIYVKKAGGRRVTVETARKIDHAGLKGITKKGDILEEKINPNLIAGVKIVVNGERQLDFSLHKKLNDIFT